MILSILIVFLLIVFAVYSAIMLLFRMGWNSIPYGKAAEDYVPVVSVSLVIPARNEEQRIEALLKDIVEQDYPREMLEVIVVDDFSEDATASVVERFIVSTGDKNRSSIRLLKLEGVAEAGAKKKAIAEAVQQAKGHLIMTTDADCRMGKGWIRAFAHYYDTQPGVAEEQGRLKMISGPVVYDAGDSFFDSFQSLEFLSLVGSGAGAIGSGLPVMCNGANLAYEKQAFLEVNGYEGNRSQASGDDVFLMHKIIDRFGTGSVGFLKDRQAIVSTFPSKTPGEFFRQRVRWGSKAPAYRDGFSLLTAVIVFLTNAGIIAGIATGLVGLFVATISGSSLSDLYSPRLLGISLMLLLLKMLVDLPVMTAITRFASQERRMIWYPLFQPVYTIYVTVTAIAGSFRKNQWKGRKI